MYSHLYFTACTSRTPRCTPHVTCTLAVLHVLHVVLRKYTQSTARVQCTLLAHESTRHFQQGTWRMLKYRVHDRVHDTVGIEYIPQYRTPHPYVSTFTVHVHQEYTPEYGTATPRCSKSYKGNLLYFQSKVSPSPSFEENLERECAAAPPRQMAADSRLLCTVRGPGTPAADAALESVATRRLVRCHQPPERL